ncbi:serine-rich adhesin for platelets isoform X2 [Episyrphus balteatus]|uniref:serine-rich adhesin for platelets isoform X2 n=1 Tax=Episyrphus balteatus TaxID=286459 RepID=UPI002485F0D0|nr:serine-rich adhesin for platelets isoform X2 [Episyrphus balteatus]
MEMDYSTFYIAFMTINVTLTFIMMLAACLCCKKKIPKNEFMGMEGMVKLKNPDDQIIINNVDHTTSQNDLNLSTISNGDSEKRASSAPHRSLPDIPINDTVDNGSELYETVADKLAGKTQDKSPNPSLKKQTSVSQHSSISQADDFSSPYSRVKNAPHDYAKVRNMEHPYAQLNAPSTSSAVAGSRSQLTFETVDVLSNDNSDSHRGSNQSLLVGSVDVHQEMIGAASAIAGMVSASQDLPYMTPPIVQQPYFSGDSQDSSSYTSISVREPLANILAQSKVRHNRLIKEGNDSHYATVSDDSDETYAAIEDPNNRAVAAEIYTSGSETYAQIQPSNQPIVVAVEINTNTSSILRMQDSADSASSSNTRTSIKPSDCTPIPPPVDSLRAQMHSRQASSSSNNSSMGNLGSPKPEKRQANSPLPPTPKNQQFLSSNSNLTSTCSLASGRNSVASVIECILPQDGSSAEDSPIKKKNFSPSKDKDIEGMYAKVMKKNKFSQNSSSQNNSPILGRKVLENNASIQEMTKITNENVNFKDYVINVMHEPPSSSIRRQRSNSYCTKDDGYETIPADKIKEKSSTIENRKSDCYAQMLQSERLVERGLSPPRLPAVALIKNFPTDSSLDAVLKLTNNEPGYESLPDQSSANNSDPGYETLVKTTENQSQRKTTSDYDPNYEVLHPTKYCTTGSDDGYAKVMEKPRIDFDDMIDGYSKVKERNNIDEDIPGYSRIGEPKTEDSTKLHDYASIAEAQKFKESITINCNNNNNYEKNSELYSKLLQQQPPPPPFPPNSFEKPLTSPSTTSQSSSADQVLIIKTSSDTPTTTLSSSSHQLLPSSNYESLTGSDSDPNYESVRYLDLENPYERLNTESTNTATVSSDMPLSTPSSTDGKNSNSDSKLLSSTGTGTGTGESATASENGDVDDYFQV